MLLPARVIRQQLRYHQPGDLSSALHHHLHLRHVPRRHLHRGHHRSPLVAAHPDSALARPSSRSFPSLSHPRVSAVDPTLFFLAAAASVGCAYLYTTYADTAEHPIPAETSQPRDTSASKTSTAPSAQQEYEYEHYFHVMAPNTQAGRPGNLTAEQTEKLKEMWAATLEVTGVAGDREKDGEGVSNGTATPTPSDASPADAKKKDKKKRSLFKKKDKTGADATSENATEDVNDKHGQTKEFQNALASMTPEELRTALWSMSKHDHPDGLLLRFLRARKWDVHAALVMMVSTMHWRLMEMHVDDDIMLHGEAGALATATSSTAPATDKKDAEGFLEQLRMGKSFLHGTDKDGRPCCFVRARLHKGGEQTEKSLERFTVYTIETARLLLRSPVDTATIVFDMTDFSLANMDYTPVKFMIKCFEANYPESLGGVLVYKAPWIFNQIWKIIRGWLDPVVAGKVQFCSNVDELSQWIPKSRIMKELGGEEAWTYSYVEPQPNENPAFTSPSAKEDKAQILAERKELQESYEHDTLSWIHGEDAGEGRNRLAQRLAENYWKLDPFVRARSLYDRWGVLGEGGKLDAYPRAGAAGGDGEVD